MKKNGITKYCEVCGKAMYVPRCLIERTRFCSLSCLAKTKVAHLNATRKKAEHNPSWFTPERAKGSNNPRWVEPVTKVCIHCGSTFERKPWEINKKGSTSDFCSKACRNDYRRQNKSGPNSPYWVGGAKTYRGRDWRRTRLIVVERQGGNCADCGRHIGKSLPVHHIKPFRFFLLPEAANHPDNLVGLCQSCHMKREGGFSKRSR